MTENSYALALDLKEATLPLEQIFLDPNNPRFVDPDWSYVSDEDIAKEAIQDEARRRLVAEFDVDKLRMNMEVNGYLPIDRVIVREFAPEKYVILEGNRRICAAKILSAESIPLALPEDVASTLRLIPCLLYTGRDTDASWIFQGLRHITGISDWSSFNKAKLLVEQMEEEGLTLTQVGKRFGLTPHGAGQWVRGYYAFKQAREDSDYINEVDARSYPYFQELFSRSSAPVREWMEWNETERRFKNALNFNEFINWLYPREEGEAGIGSGKAEWERRQIRRQDDVRQIAFLITKDKQAFEQFRSEGDLERSYSMAVAKQYETEAKKDADPAAEVFTALESCIKALDNIPLKILKDVESRERLFGQLEHLERLIGPLKEESRVAS